MAEENNWDREKLQEETQAGQNCERCTPYIERCLQEGQDSFDLFKNFNQTG